MNPWGTTWHPEWHQQPHPHVYIPPQPFARPTPPAGYWDPSSWSTTAAYQHDNFRSRRYPNLNPILAADSTLLRYDVRIKPRENILTSTYHSQSHTATLATQTSHIRLISKSFPWTIDVKSAHGSITCELIWDALYFGLQEPLADSEWGMILLDDDLRERIERAARKREEKDNDKRLKRIDWLGDNTLFKGLEKDEPFEKLRLLPRAEACLETWVVRLGGR